MKVKKNQLINKKYNLDVVGFFSYRKISAEANIDKTLAEHS